MFENVKKKFIECWPFKEQPRPDVRTVLIGDDSNQIPFYVETEDFPSNRIVSSQYTIINFLPKNLFEQFHRIANIYFLIVALISLFVDTSVSALTTIIPLLFVVIVTAIKQGYEDYLRHKADDEVNNKLCFVVRHGELEMVKAKDIKVGDILRVQNNKEIPCDVILLSTSEGEGTCFITTANLDGETNLKTYVSVSKTRHIVQNDEFEHLRAIIECQQPTSDFYRFAGRIMVIKTGGEHQHMDNNIAPVRRSSIFDEYSVEFKQTTLSNKIYDNNMGEYQIKELEEEPTVNFKNNIEFAEKSFGINNLGYNNLNDGRKELHKISLGPENLLLRGTRLKNTQFIYGCAIYTGQDTKISLNSKYKSQKYSRIEKKLNTFLIVYIVVLCVFSFLWVFWTFLFYLNDTNNDQNVWYLAKKPTLSFKLFVQEFFIYMVLYNYIIPISMYVTVELQKFFGSMFYEWDVLIYDAESNEPAKALTSDLNEELGQVQMLFSDKTGTLTENEMRFRQCSASGVVYQQLENGHLSLSNQNLPLTKLPDDVEELFLALCVCHSVRVDHKVEESETIVAALLDRCKYEYQSSSPDEKALVEAACKLGIIYEGILDENLIVEVNGVKKYFRLKHVLEFDSARKKMSVIVQNDNDEFVLYTKGAETAIFENVTKGDVDNLEKHVNQFAILGLRTLVVAKRGLSKEEYLMFDEELMKSRTAIANRQEMLDATFSKIESNLELLGATAIEDKLQEGVPETISALRRAGIQIWVLTGDKEETAVNISYSAGHLDHNMQPLSLTKMATNDECLSALENFNQLIEEHLKTKPKCHALIIDGKSLSFALQFHSELLRRVCLMCVTVLCCRMSPIQKALVVKLMKESSDQPTTCAIGDGANDVNMIQEAHVGIGVMGKEGRQAVRSSDYAIGKFRFLKRTLLVHGHYFYHRLALLVMYFFYKNVAMIMPQLYFTFFNGFSAQTLYSSYYLVFFNLTFTALPILLYSIFEKHVADNLLEHKPFIYRTLRSNSLMDSKIFIKYNIIGLWHSIPYYFGVHLATNLGNSLFENGWSFGIFDMGFLVMTICVIAVNIKLMFDSYDFNAVIIFGFVLSIGGYFLLTAFEDLLLWSVLSETIINYGVMQVMLNSANVWLLMVMCVTWALLPDIFMRAWNDEYHPLYSANSQALRRKREADTKTSNSDLISVSTFDDDDVTMQLDFTPDEFETKIHNSAVNDKRINNQKPNGNSASKPRDSLEFVNDAFTDVDL